MESIVLLLPLRLGLAGLFGIAAALKLSDPQAFAFAIKAFDVLDPASHGHALVTLAFTIPWAEMLVSVLLLLGLWTRASGLLLALMLAAFTAGLLNVIASEIDTDCACFGDLEFFCKGGVGWCHIGRNAVLLLASAILVCRGGGGLSLDAFLAREPGVDSEPQPT